MKALLAALALTVASSTALAADPVTKIAGFQCHARGADAKYMIWTERAGETQVVTLGTMGESGIESVEKFVASRVHLDDIVTFTSKDETLKVAITNDFDGEFYTGDMALTRNGNETFQELACEEYVIKDEPSIR